MRRCVLLCAQSEGTFFCGVGEYVTVAGSTLARLCFRVHGAMRVAHGSADHVGSRGVYTTHHSPGQSRNSVGRRFVGSETRSALACPHEAGEDAFYAPSESVVVACVGDGGTQGRPAKEATPRPLLGGLASLAPAHRVSVAVTN